MVTKHFQKGFVLLEALIAFVVLAGSLMAVYSFHSVTLESTAEAKIRAQAAALAEQKLEELRSFTSVTEFDRNLPRGKSQHAGLGDYEDKDGVIFDAVFTRTWEINGPTTHDDPRPYAVSVTVSWKDRADNAQELMLSTLIWRSDPGLNGVWFYRVFRGGSGSKADWLPVDELGNPITAFDRGNVERIFYDVEGNVIELGSFEFEDSGFENLEFESPEQYTVDSYDILLRGKIDFAGQSNGLERVVIRGGPSGVAKCTALAPKAREYYCAITGISAHYKWLGSLSYYPTGSSVVCQPSNGMVTDLTFSVFGALSVPLPSLNVVVRDEESACDIKVVKEPSGV